MAGKNRISPSANGANGLQARDEKGRFLPGNPGGPGNPHAAAVGAWRAALVNAVTADDVWKVIGVLADKAKAGEAWAVRELLDRCLGRPQQKSLLQVEVPEYVHGRAAGDRRPGFLFAGRSLEVAKRIGGVGFPFLTGLLAASAA